MQKEKLPFFHQMRTNCSFSPFPINSVSAAGKAKGIILAKRNQLHGMFHSLYMLPIVSPGRRTCVRSEQIRSILRLQKLRTYISDKISVLGDVPLGRVCSENTTPAPDQNYCNKSPGLLYSLRMSSTNSAVFFEFDLLYLGKQLDYLLRASIKVLRKG